VVEYAALSSIAATFASTRAAVEGYLQGMDTNVILGVVAVVAFLAWISRR
jgi:hypothetical protein